MKNRVRFLTDYGLPDRDAVRLLRACLPVDGVVPDAETLAWCIARTAAGSRGLMPLLAARVGERSEGEPLRKLRAARLYEQQRVRRFAGIFEEVVARMTAHGIAPMASRGLVLAGTAYPVPEARHCHDLDLIVPDIAAAEVALAEAGFELDRAAGNYRHRSEMIACLHERPLPTGDAALAGFAGDCRPGTALGVALRVPDPTTVLRHVLLLAAHRPNPTLFWATDAWFAVRRTAIDWDAIGATRGPEALFLLRGLGFVERELDADVPAGALALLAESAAAMTMLERVTCLKRAARWYGRRALVRALVQRAAV